MRSNCISVLLVLLPVSVYAATYDYEFMPAGGWSGLAETGGDDASTNLAEGFPGLTTEVGKETSTEPVDGSGGFDNVAPRLSVEEGPGGLEWDPSPTYRTRYQGATDYPAGASQLQGNNWFTKMPTISKDTTPDKYLVRFDANTFRVYDRIPGTNPAQYVGRYGNKNSKIFENQYGVPSLYDIRGKTYVFNGQNGVCTQISGLGGNNVTITYGTSITVSQGTNIRRFTYTLASNRIDKIDVEEYVGGSWSLYRKINFTYHENVTGAVESATGDLVGIEDEKLLSPASTWSKQRWVFKYFTGTYNSSTNPGYPYQVKAVLGPQSVRDFEIANSGVDIYTKTATELSAYVDRTYKYHSDKRVKELDLKSGCGCGGGEGLYTYTYDVNGSTPTDMVTWYRRATITLPSVNGSSRIIDYNLYGQTLNHVVQEVAGNSSSRRWIRTWTRDTTARLTESFSVKACTSYTDSTHTVTTNSTGGQRFTFAYDSNSALTTVKLRDPANANLNYQLKKAISLVTSGDRRRFVKTSDTIYPTETTTDTGGLATSYSYTYHASDGLAVKLRTTTLPTVATGENGSGSALTLKDWFETDGLHTWTKDSDDCVHCTCYDANDRTPTKHVINMNTSSPPSGVPSSPDTTFNTSSGLNLVTDSQYDALRRMKEVVSPSFTDDTNSSMTPCRSFFHTKISTEDLVTIEYPQVEEGVSGSYQDAALTMTCRDLDGNAIETFLGELSGAYCDATLSDDFASGDPNMIAAFNGTMKGCTKDTFSAGKLIQRDVWIDADGADDPSNKHTTTFTHDAAGRLLTTTNSVGTITRYTYDVLNRKKSVKVGTVDGGGGDNMTIVEENFYDDEEDTSTNVGDGNLTRGKRYSESGVARTTDTTFDYRQRPTQIDEPLSVREKRFYTNLNEVCRVELYDSTSGEVLLSKDETYFDAWRQVYETRTYGIVGGSGTGYSNVRTWRNGRGLVVKEQSQGKVFQKTQYDGAGRVTNQAVSYDTAESSYADADDLTGDTVMQETRIRLDSLGSRILVGVYERRHDGTGTGGLTVGTSGNSRAQYTATWYDKLHRPTSSVNYGTNGGTDLSDRPSGAPPSSSSSSYLVTKITYTEEGQVYESTDPQGIKTRFEYDDPGRVLTKIENYSDGTPGPGTDVDRRTEYTYNGLSRVVKTTAKVYVTTGDPVDQVTQNVYGVTKTDSPVASKIASNDLLRRIDYPDPSTGVPTTSDVDREYFSYNAKGETIWRKDQDGTVHEFDHDSRGRVTADRVTGIGSGVENDASLSIRRIERTYDALDRPISVTTYNAATGGTAKNGVQYEYEKFGVASKLYQEMSGVVSTGTSRKVQFAYSFPTDGTTGLRRTSITETDGSTVITDVYNSGTDDTLNRVSGQKRGTNWLFQDFYLGVSSLVTRKYGTTTVEWTLVGTDSSNQDNYLGLDRFGRTDKLVVKDTSSGTVLNDYLYTYNYNSQVTVREDLVGKVGSSWEFSETYGYDGLGRLTEHRRGVLSGGTISTIKWRECWTLERSGNRKDYYAGTSGSACTGQAATFNASNENTSSGFAYSIAGNMTTNATTKTHMYSAWNQMKDAKVSSVQVAYYHYNGKGQKTWSALDSKFYYRVLSDQILEERDSSNGSLLKDYIWGTQYIDDLVIRTSSSPEFMVLDENFNVVTRLNSSGTVVARYCYDAYGMPKQLSADWNTWQSISEDLHLFTGRLYSRVHTQYDFRNREQDPGLGCFVQKDPIGIWADPSSYGNGYAYAAHDPRNLTDALGLAPHWSHHEPCDVLLVKANASIGFTPQFIDSPFKTIGSALSELPDIDKAIDKIIGTNYTCECTFGCMDCKGRKEVGWFRVIVEPRTVPTFACPGTDVGVKTITFGVENPNDCSEERCQSDVAAPYLSCCWDDPDWRPGPPHGIAPCEGPECLVAGGLAAGAGREAVRNLGKYTRRYVRVERHPLSKPLRKYGPLWHINFGRRHVTNPRYWGEGGFFGK